MPTVGFPTSVKRHPSLDVLRAVAALIVVFHHTTSLNVPALVVPTAGWLGFLLRNVREMGWAGVDLFFVLSGFLISGVILSEVNRRGLFSVRRFWARRAFKILPPYYILLLVLAVTGATGYLKTGSVSEFVRSLGIHALFLQNYLDNRVNGATWTLAVEEHFYLLFPAGLFALLAFLRWDRSRFLAALPWAAGAMIALPFFLRLQHVFSPGGVGFESYKISHYRFDALSMGVLCQCLWRYRRPFVLRLVAPRWLFWPVMAACWTLAAVYRRSDPWMFSAGFLALSLGFGWVVLYLSAYDWTRWGRNPVFWSLSRIGEASYSIYLWHYFISRINLPYYGTAQKWMGTLALPTDLVYVLQAACYALTALIVGAFFYRLIEIPCFAWRDRVVPSDARAIRWRPPAASV